MPHPMRRPGKPAAPGSIPAINVSLKSLRNPPLDLSLKSQSLTTSVLDLKQAVAGSVGSTGTEKIKLLYKKKPCSDSKTLKDVVGDEISPGGEAEFSVMIMGGPATVVGEKVRMTTEEVPDVVMGGTGEKAEEKDEASVAQGVSGIDSLESEEFWSDLQGFLLQRLRNQEVAEKALRVFRDSWGKKCLT